MVTHNSGPEIEACLDAITQMAAGAQIFVIDNASRDDTVARVRKFARDRGARVELLENPENKGFAGAVNQGVRAAGPADFLLLLNPDAVLLDPVEPVVEAARVNGLSAGKLVAEDGKPQAGFTIRRFPTPLALAFEILGVNRLWPSNPVNRNYRYMGRDLEQPGPVEQPAGAFLMTRRDVWERLGGMDEQFHPVWFEDVDFCRRASALGFRAAYVPSVGARHTGGHSVSRVPSGCRAVLWYGSLLKYARKHYRPMQFRGICLAVALSSVPRMVAGMIAERSFKPVAVYSRIFWVAGLLLIAPSRSPKVAGPVQI